MHHSDIQINNPYNVGGAMERNMAEKIIVSFTSYPRRIYTVDKVIDSILKQTVLPNKIVLYLSQSEFEGVHDMPDFGKYEKYGFEIHWYKENLKSHKNGFTLFGNIRMI